MVQFCLIPSMTHANDGAYIPSWEIGEDKNDIHPKRLTLQDIEQKLPQIAFAPSNETTRQIPKTESTIERLYSDRIIDNLEQYGYDLFLNTPKKQHTIPAGSVQDDFILSAGDQLDIVLRGQINSRNDYTIDTQGRLILPDMPPITAAGRTLKDIKQELEADIKSLHNTQIYISLSGVRQINVLVVGHVKNPGRQNLTVFHSVLDALSEAGGIQKTGTLRNIKLIRNGNSQIIDLYHLLMSDSSGADSLLKEGDRIIVPPLGATMAVSGSVKRPAIYELKKGSKISLHQALGTAGGGLTPGKNRYIKLEYTKNGEETVTDVSAPNNKIFGDGSILMVAQGQAKRSSTVTLSGHTRQAGTHDLKKAKTLADLITDKKVLGDDIYPLIGIIKRHDPDNLTKKLVSFSPQQVLQKNDNDTLTEGDSVQLFSMAQIRSLTKEKQRLLHKASLQKDALDTVTKSFLMERTAFIRGAVRQAGAYPLAKQATLESLIAVAGGTALEANIENIEVTSKEQGRLTINLSTQNAKDIFIHAGDTIRVNQKFHKISEQSVMIIGEVNHPGRYDLSAGDTLLTLVERAGGMTDQAYPNGSIFSRASERKREENRYKAQAQDLQLKLAASLEKSGDNDKKPDMSQIKATENLIAQLKHAEAVGRITVESNPVLLHENPDLDILLEKGDKIYIPKRPLTVRVSGEVLAPASLQFRKGKDPLDYIREAGGTSYYADKDRTFVIYPDGSAQPLRVSSWNHSAALIPPGSTVIVPRDPKPFDFLESAERISQLLANLAISGLYIEAIGDD